MRIGACLRSRDHTTVSHSGVTNYMYRVATWENKKRRDREVSYQDILDEEDEIIALQVEAHNAEALAG